MSNQERHSARRKSALFPPAIVLFVGVLATSTSAILIRLAQEEAPSLVIAAARLTLSTALLTPWAVARRRQELTALSPAAWKLALLSGFMLGLHFAAFIASLDYTSIAASTVLATTTPIWVGLAAPLVLDEPLTPALRAGIVLAIAGSALIGLGDTTGGSSPLLGNSLALSSALTGAVYFLIGRRLRARLSLLSYTTVVYGMAALTLLGLSGLSGLRFAGYSAATYLLFLLMALGPQLLGHSSYNYALGFVPAAYVSVAIVSEPIGASILGALIFGEVPGLSTVVGGSLILAGILFASRRRSPRSPP